jgi:hypothetical protein
MMETKWITCPTCEQQFDEEIDGVDCIFELVYCGHWVCISCSYDHIADCEQYWSTRENVHASWFKKDS